MSMQGVHLSRPSVLYAIALIVGLDATRAVRSAMHTHRRQAVSVRLVQPHNRCWSRSSVLPNRRQLSPQQTSSSSACGVSDTCLRTPVSSDNYFGRWSVTQPGMALVQLYEVEKG